MGRYNLLDEPWISILVDESGKSREVSLKEVFRNAHKYIDLAGDTKTQDFSTLRLLLAVLHTVFSRFSADGEEYAFFKLDERFKQVEKIREDDLEDYKDKLCDTWFDLWESKEFPDIIQDYLEKWRDRFYLFDDKYPFYQVVNEDITSDKISKSEGSEILGKNINRCISQSANKISLFSPKYELDNNKEKMTYPQMVRWLIHLQNYIGLSDKVIFGKDKYTASKGWLFDLGGIYLKGKNLFETLLLNFYILNEENNNLLNIQEPCWELTSNEMIKKFLKGGYVSDVAGLYTAWSRAAYIDKDITENSIFSCKIVKLANINHQDNFIEPMTLWKYNKDGDNKDKFTPRKHQKNKSVWRNFGLLTGFEDATPSNKIRQPGIINWLNTIEEEIGNQNVTICAASMEDDANATSWVPVDEILDEINVNNTVLADMNSWVVRINEVVDNTKLIIDFYYKNYLKDILEIRNSTDKGFVETNIERIYFLIDESFKTWLSNIKKDDDPNIKIKQWNKILKSSVINQAKSQLESGNTRDFRGIEKDGKVKNIATAYNAFLSNINKHLIVEEES
ncbi:type I-E CRISPR-associated protein Cse1/CasA [Criibacterium bergeronii]|uniref:Type I-E CRISPR-associated protein Cse1/CasA n=1 Tax=Criibacterium bergeronii TaxID=1871336 RepID=A0A371ILF3_9FIRM|nr:type I-E CRISPR-associated protein Cse1/CasA [Criibacterium bergeronii]RDY21313.1 type I-E CRISPR-associated protein Cse1/CasA [Criibacterium bergeronii]